VGAGVPPPPGMDRLIARAYAAVVEADDGGARLS
jgi:hypothetical protein